MGLDCMAQTGDIPTQGARIALHMVCAPRQGFAHEPREHRQKVKGGQLAQVELFLGLVLVRLAPLKPR